MVELRCTIEISKNRFVEPGQAPVELSNRGYLAMKTIQYKNRNGRWVTLSGFWVGRDKVSMYPLFRRHGNKHVELTAAEYHALIDNADLHIGDLTAEDLEFAPEMSKSAREHLKNCNP